MQFCTCNIFSIFRINCNKRELYNENTVHESTIHIMKREDNYTLDSSG